MFGSAVAPFIATPTFVLNSKYDLWQSKQIIHAGSCGSNISACPAPLLKFWVDYGNSMLTMLDALPPRHGAYLHNCQQHCQTGVGSWNTDTVNGTVMHAAVATWCVVLDSRPAIPLLQFWRGLGLICVLGAGTRQPSRAPRNLSRGGSTGATSCRAATTSATASNACGGGRPL